MYGAAMMALDDTDAEAAEAAAMGMMGDDFPTAGDSTKPLQIGYEGCACLVLVPNVDAALSLLLLHRQACTTD